MNRLDIVFKDAEQILEKVDFSFLENKTVTLTGATGMLGTYFLATLALLKEHGMKINIFGVCHSAPADYTSEIAKRGHLRLIDKPYFESDVIIHAAGYAQPRKFTINQAETIKINTTQTQELLELLKLDGKFLFISSSEVYSGNSNIVTEDDIGTTTPYHPRACYIEGKRCGEAIVNAYRLTCVDAKSARLGLTYGPGTRKNDERAMSGFIREALTLGFVDLLYSGRQQRNFCYVSDAVEILWNILLHGKEPVYNVGGRTFIDMAAVAMAVTRITKTQLLSKQDYHELPGSGEVRMDARRANKEFNKNRYVFFDEGLERTIDWNRGLYEAV